MTKKASKEPCHLFNVRTTKRSMGTKIQMIKKTAYCPLESEPNTSKKVKNDIFLKSFIFLLIALIWLQYQMNSSFYTVLFVEVSFWEVELLWDELTSSFLGCFS